MCWSYRAPSTAGAKSSLKILKNKKPANNSNQQLRAMLGAGVLVLDQADRSEQHRGKEWTDHLNTHAHHFADEAEFPQELNFPLLVRKVEKFPPTTTGRSCAAKCCQQA
jgi:hypothetical protein